MSNVMDPTMPPQNEAPTSNMTEFGDRTFMDISEC